MRAITGRKIERISQALSNDGFKAAVFVSGGALDDKNVQYLTGLGGSGGAVIVRGGRVELIVGSIDYDRAASEAQVDEITKADGKEFGRVIAKKCAGLAKVGCCKRMLSAHAWDSMRKKGIKLSDASEIIDAQRAIKEPGELEAIEKCAGIANRGVRFLDGFLCEGRKESDVSAELEMKLRKLGSEKPPFETIVTSGKRSAFIHPSPSATSCRIVKGLGLIDFGATFKGYVCDTTVPFTCGRLSKKQENIMDAVMEARDEMIRLVAPGTKAKEIMGAFENALKARGLEAKHSGGHGIGLEVHEHPSLSVSETACLKPGMALAVEPGAYVPGAGGLRIENDFIITKSGCRQLTKSKLIRL